MNVQRQVIYEQRNSVLHGADLSEEIREEWLPEVISNVVSDYTATELSEDWELGDLVAAMDTLYGTGVAAEELTGLERDQVVQEFLDDALDAYAEREKEIEALEEGLMRQLERFIILQVVDTRWREHLENMDYMREGIGLRGLAQKDPLVEYRNEGALMFQDLNRAIREEVIALLFHAEVDAHRRASSSSSRARTVRTAGSRYEHQSLSGSEAILAAGGTSTAAAGFASAGGVATPVAQRPKVNSEFENVGRNDLCPCGSGKKFKKCHGASDATGDIRRLPGPRSRCALLCPRPRPWRCYARSLRPCIAWCSRPRKRAMSPVTSLARPEPALADDEISLEPLAEALAPEFGWVLDGDADTDRFTLIPSRPDGEVPHDVARALRARLGGRLVRRVRGPRRRDRSRDRLRGVRPARPREAAGRDRVRRGCGGTRPWRRRPRGPPPHELGLRRARARAHRAAHRSRERAVGACGASGRLPPRRDAPQHVLQGRPAKRLRHLGAPRERVIS